MSQQPFDWKALYNRADKISFDPVPEGRYLTRVIDAYDQVSSNGNPMLRVKVQIISGEHNGKILFTQLVLSRSNDTALGMFFANLEALGFNKEFFGTYQGDLSAIASQMTERTVCVIVVHEIYQNEISARIKRFVAPRPDELQQVSSNSGGVPGITGTFNMPGGMSGVPGGMSGALPGIPMTFPASQDLPPKKIYTGKEEPEEEVKAEAKAEAEAEAEAEADQPENIGETEQQQKSDPLNVLGLFKTDRPI